MADPTIPGNPGPLTEQTFAVYYMTDYGLRQQTPCGPVGTPSRFVRVYAPAAQKIVLWAAQCMGGKPQLPAINTGTANEVPLAKLILAGNPGCTLDGSPVWTVIGQFTYGLQVPPSESDALTIACGSFLGGDNVSVNVISPSDFVTKFLSPSAPPSGFGGGIVNW